MGGNPGLDNDASPKEQQLFWYGVLMISAEPNNWPNRRMALWEFMFQSSESYDVDDML